MVDCDVRTHQKRSVIVASAQSLPPPPFAMGNCFVPMGTRSRLLPPAPSCRQQGDARWTKESSELSWPPLPLSTCTGLRLVGAELVESVSAASAMQSRCSRKSGTWTSVHRE